MTRVLKLAVVVLLILAIAGCAAGPNALAGTPDLDGDVAGFWWGLWHGLITPITFVISLFSDKVQVYEVHNTGNWYNFGFLFGLTVSLGGSGGGAARRRRRSKNDD